MGASATTGSVIGGFRVVRVVGAGAMGTVYLAEGAGGERVALKVLTPELSGDERFRQRFERESALAALLDHPSVVRTLASGEADGALYLAMAYVDGSDLREILRREGRLEPARAVALVAQVAAALDAAHERGLVHRDVKPGNILVADGPDGEQAFVCDFGLARHVSSVSSLTGDRGFVGTIDYIPPEQVEGDAIDGRADVYSLGCVLFECLAGEKPFERESELSVVFAHLNEPPPRITERRPDLPLAFDDVFATALAKSPSDRYGSCGELAVAAVAALDGKVVPRRRRRRRRRLLALAAVLAAAGATAGGIVATRGGSAPAPTARITQTAIDGLPLGRPAAFYERRLGGYRQSTLTEPGFPFLSFQDPEVAVYFPPDVDRAIVITTWNRAYRTAKGVGPCSTLADLKRAYGDEAKPAASASLRNGTVWAYTVGKNLLFAVRPSTGIVPAVALYDGGAPHAHSPVHNTTWRRGAESWANYVVQNETSCAPG